MEIEGSRGAKEATPGVSEQKEAPGWKDLVAFGVEKEVLGEASLEMVVELEV